jgi:signal peptidase I
MSELPRDLRSPLSAPETDKPANSTSRWKQAAIAGLLSLFFPGMGQLFNRQPRKAFGIAILTHILGALVAHTRLLLSFWTMVASFFVLLAWQLSVAVEAARAATAKKPESPVPLPWLAYPLIGIIIIVSALAPSPAHTMHESGFLAYKVPSSSMCPTLCAGDRIVGNAWAYHWKPPQRGALILLKHPSSDALMIKRVIALPGDLVAPGPAGSIFVNGQPFSPHAPCGHFAWVKAGSSNSSSSFQARKVPDGTFFVVGDNLDHSFDTRVPEFGPVTLDMLRGEPLYFYWSPGRSRIACTIH